ncbi:hypothetical protein ACS0TY_020915 [Phlomoides rotata]
MVRPPRFDNNGMKSGVWSKKEDETLRAFVYQNGHHNWQKLPILAGLARSGKSCRLRWVNYLQPGLKKGNFSKEEVDLIITMHNQIGNKWSAIAEKLPGRSDNDIKNQWHAHIKKRSRVVRRSAEMGREEQSFEINCCKESNHQEQTPAFDEHRFLSTPFPEEEFSDFGLRHNDTPTFSGSSDGGITHSDDTCFRQLKIDDFPPFPEEEFSDFGLCYNDTPTYSDSSDGGVSYDDHKCFTQLNIDLPPLIPEEEFSTFGLCYNDTPNFSNSSDGSGIAYENDHTCFTQFNNIHLPPFPEEEFSDFGLCYNGTPTLSDSSDTYDHTCFSQLNIDLPQFREEDFSDLGLYQNYTPSFSDSSDCAVFNFEE